MTADEFTDHRHGPHHGDGTAGFHGGSRAAVIPFSNGATAGVSAAPEPATLTIADVDRRMAGAPPPNSSLLLLMSMQTSTASVDSAPSSTEISQERQCATKTAHARPTHDRILRATRRLIVLASPRYPQYRAPPHTRRPSDGERSGPPEAHRVFALLSRANPAATT